MVEQLPRGKHALSREQVLASQRRRMLDGIADAVAERGYGQTSVAEVIRRAGVSRDTFYQQFDDKLACFLAAYDDGVERLRARLLEAFSAADGSPLERVTATLDAYLEQMRGEPSFARAFLVEVYAAGPAALERRALLHSNFADLIATVMGAGTRRERFRCEALVAASSALLATRVSLGDVDELPALREDLLDLVVTLLEPAGSR